MTIDNCIKLLEAYKKQMINPVDSDGRPLHSDQAKHAIERSKINYKNMAMNILTSKKFNGGTMDIRVKGGIVRKTFPKHPIVDELKKEFGLIKEEPKEEEPKEEIPKETKGVKDGKKSKG
jgi:hypothetical protein